MRIIAVLLLILGLAGAGLWNVLHSFGAFESVTRDFAGQCAPVTGVVGPEDIVLDRSRKLAFISSLDRRDDAARGAIHIFDPADPLASGSWRDMTDGAPEAFRPLGIDYYEDDDVRRLFVVNEASSGVEVFDVAEDGMLAHRQTYTERRLTSPNNVVATGPDSFYVTNDVKPGRNTAMGSLHFLTRAASGEIFYIDGGAWSLAAEGLRFANGLAMSEGGARLYAAETSAAAVRVYDRDPATGILKEDRVISLSAAPDNLFIAEDGALWAAALPKPLSVPALASDASKNVPSQIIRLGKDDTATSIYRDDGAELSAATGAVVLDGALIIGALYGERFLLCELPADAF